MAVDAAGKHQFFPRIDNLLASPRSSPSAAIRPALMPTSQRNVSDAVTTVPPRMIVSKAMRLFYHLCCV